MRYRFIDRRTKAPDGVTPDSLAAPTTGNRLYYDLHERGLALRITANGVRAWCFNYRHAGRERRYTIGQWPAWTVAGARERARELRREVDRDCDPLEQRTTVRDVPTVADLCERYETDVLPRKRASSQREDRALLAILRREMGTRRVAEVEFVDVEDLHAKLTRGRAPVRANRLVQLVVRLFNLAIRWQMRPDNPARGIERNPEAKRERYLARDELAALLAALDDRKDASADAVRLLLLTGARRGEVLGATWGQFDLDGAVWVKPGAATKQKKLHRVPLSAPAVDVLRRILARRRKRPAADEVLFPGGGASGVQGDLKRAWATISRRASVLLWRDQVDTPAGAIVRKLAELLDREPRFDEVVRAARSSGVTLPAGLTDLRVHDLRHSYASFLASAGLSLPTIGALLGHTQPGTTARYAHLLDDPLRQATDVVGALVGAGKGGAGAEKPS